VKPTPAELGIVFLIIAILVGLVIWSIDASFALEDGLIIVSF
jgi:hypothetical protein